jgi:hypothetical protein
MKNIFKRDAHLPIISRKHTLAQTRTIDTLYGPELIFLIKDCPACFETKPLNSFYVKENMQHIPPEELLPHHFRKICIACYDSKEKLRPRRKKSEIKKEKLERERAAEEFLALCVGSAL